MPDTERTTITEKMEAMSTIEREAYIGRFAYMSVSTNTPKRIWLPKLTELCNVYANLEGFNK